MEIFAVAAQGGVVRQFGEARAGEAGEILVGQGARDLARTVGAEVHEHRHVAVLHDGRFADHGDLHELVVLAAHIGGFQRFQRSGGAERCDTLREHVVSDLHALPAVVAVHGEEAPADAGNASRAKLRALVLQRLQRGCGAARRCIAAVEECVDENLFQSGARRQFQHGVDVQLVAVHAAGGEQPHDVQRRADLFGCLDCFDQRGIGKEAAVLDGQIDLGQILVHHASGADVQMAHFRIAHLPLGQTDTQFGGVDQGMRIGAPQPVPVRLARSGDGIEIGILAIAEAIKDEQEDRGDWSGMVGHVGFFGLKTS